ncbi:MAG TPA: hypothetical protein VL854_13475 [Nitrososphaeraceae archaeon]|nr:hypothetical protein [Nitrososphaeraceae archaeon]
MVILIDPSDQELFLLMKAIADSEDGNIEAEHSVLMKLIEEKGRRIQVDYFNDDNIRISFPKKKRFGIF